jgi:hypothetical protein
MFDSWDVLMDGINHDVFKLGIASYFCRWGDPNNRLLYVPFATNAAKSSSFLRKSCLDRICLLDGMASLTVMLTSNVLLLLLLLKLKTDLTNDFVYFKQSDKDSGI